MDMSQPAEESAPAAPESTPEAQPVQDTPAPPEATPAPPEAPITAIPEPVATSNGADAVVSVEVSTPDPEPPNLPTPTEEKAAAGDVAPGWHDLIHQVGEMRLRLTDLEGVQDRLEAAMKQNESLQEQLALHQAAANTSAADVLRQIAALVKPFE